MPSSHCGSARQAERSFHSRSTWRRLDHLDKHHSTARHVKVHIFDGQNETRQITIEQPFN
jgi:hypothetical protein